MTAARKTLLRLPLALCSLLLLAACVSMPSDGPVIDVEDADTPSITPGVGFDPQPPQGGESPAEIVVNFLEAMTAKPSGVKVARAFLTTEAQQRWAPDQGVMTYGERGDPQGTERISLELTGIEEYDARGAWQRSRASQQTTFALSDESGEWRIDELPDALIVPETWFEGEFRRMSLYYFDPSAQILVPEPVHVPSGDQLASALVGGLLDDPAADDQVARTSVPPGFTYELSVPITSAGVAQVSLVGAAADVDADARQRILTQLVWTMRQEPRVRAVRLTIGNDEQDLPDAATQVNLDVGDSFDPTGADSSDDLFGLVDGLLVRGSTGSLQATTGPFGQGGLGVRTIGVSLDGERVAGVANDGRSLLVAPVEGEGRAVQVASGARDLLPPAWDFSDRIWLADRTVVGAAISVVAGEKPPRRIDVPGISGRNVRHVIVSRDGSRLVAVVRTPDGDRVLASRILHSETGRVLGATRAVLLDFVPDGTTTTIRDIGWRSPTTVAVLTDIQEDLSQVETISVDGSPGDLSIGGVLRVRGAARTLVSSPVQDLGVLAVSGRTVSDLTAPERPLGLLPGGLTSLTYVG